MPQSFFQSNTVSEGDHSTFQQRVFISKALLPVRQQYCKAIEKDFDSVRSLKNNFKKIFPKCCKQGCNSYVYVCYQWTHIDIYFYDFRNILTEYRFCKINLQMYHSELWSANIFYITLVNFKLSFGICTCKIWKYFNHLFTQCKLLIKTTCKLTKLKMYQGKTILVYSIHTLHTVYECFQKK